MNGLVSGAQRLLQVAGGSLAGRTLLRWATNRPAGRARGRKGRFLRLALRARYASTAWFTYQRQGCERIDLRLAGAALDLYYIGDYEPETLGPLVTLGRRARTFLDIGAQAGVYSMVVASANPDVDVFAFEADPTSVAIVLDNSCRNAARPGVGSVHVCAAAVDATTSLATFHLAGGNSSLNRGFRSNTQELLCPTVSIDEFLVAVGHEAPIDLVKIDTESTEPAVLRGMVATIERWRPVIAIEVLRGRTEAELDRFLAESNYRALWLRPDGAQPVDSVVGDTDYNDLNYLFVPEERTDEIFPLLMIAGEPGPAVA